MHDPLLTESPEERHVVSGMPRAHDPQRPLHLRRIQHLLALLTRDKTKYDNVCVCVCVGEGL